MLQHPIRVVQFGLGAIGSDIARLVGRQPGLALVGGIEQDERKIGADLGELLELGQPLDVRVRGDVDAVLRQSRPDVVVIATTSLLHDVFPQIRACLAARAHVVSTCEELVYPFADDPHASTSIDEAARAAGVSVLGVGANPGFAMDLLPIFLTGPSSAVRKVSVTRAVDARSYRWTLQQRLGVGLERAAFRDWARQRTTPHVGLRQSLHMIAGALGWRLDQVVEGIEPILAEQWVETPYVSAAPGQVAGIHQWARGLMARETVIDLEWRTAVGLAETYDAVRIDGMPPLDVLIRGGIHGDLATATLVTRAIPLVMSARPGLRTVLDLPVTHYQARPREQTPPA
jgi:4-hydroxy-tetrahydrodipicolinate reductase